MLRAFNFTPIETTWPVDLYVDEQVLWNARPDTALRITSGSLATVIFVIAMVLGCFGLATVVDRSAPGIFWTILGPALIAAIGIMITPFLIDRYERCRTQYRITTHRILIMRGITVDSYPLPAAAQLRISDHAPKTITLGHNRRNRPIMLERLVDADDVFKQLNDLATSRHAA